jgi:isoamylase
MTLTLGVTASSRWAAAEGLPCPLGATRIEEEDACNFALYSKHAQSVTLLLYTENEIVNPI